MTQENEPPLPRSAAAATTQHWAAYPRRKAESIDASYKSAAINVDVRQAMVDALASAVPIGSKVLDVGCGTGDITVAAHDRGFKMTGLDVSSGMTSVLQENIGTRDINFLVADIFSAPAEETFDAATCRFVFGHYADFGALLAAIAAHVRPGGAIVFDSLSTDALYPWAAVLNEEASVLAARFYSGLKHFDRASLERACAGMGLLLEKQLPAHLFHRNPSFAASFDNIVDYDQALSAHLSNPAVRKFVNWLQACTSTGSVPGLSASVINIVRKL